MSFDHKEIKLCITRTTGRQKMVETTMAYYKFTSSHPAFSTAK